jgi:pimeloyl-ACP methyl ester carboxylesterase
MAGTVDGFIPTAAVQRLHRHWPGSRLDWVHAGHGSLMWRRKDRLVNTIEDSFDRAAALGR